MTNTQINLLTSPGRGPRPTPQAERLHNALESAGAWLLGTPQDAAEARRLLRALAAKGGRP